MSVIQPFDRDDLKRQYESAEPFPFLCIDNFLDPEFAKAVSESYPTFESASGRGFSFDYVNERKKVQVTDVSKFPDPVKTLHDAISGQSFLDELAYITGIPNLLSDEKLLGGGMHVTGPHGRLDVHVDFNYVQDRELHRRLNILIYLNPRWDNDWGGEVELWDQDVRRCYQSLRPVINRCVIFRTDESSFHGVTELRCPEGFERKSFAAYYYTKEPPLGWDGTKHTTIFRARPDERWRGYVLMPAEKLKRQLRQRADRVTHRVKRLVGMG